jgi:hypothetical protein
MAWLDTWSAQRRTEGQKPFVCSLDLQYLGQVLRIPVNLFFAEPIE